MDGWMDVQHQKCTNLSETFKSNDKMNANPMTYNQPENENFVGGQSKQDQILIGFKTAAVVYICVF